MDIDSSLAHIKQANYPETLDDIALAWNTEERSVPAAILQALNARRLDLAAYPDRPVTYADLQKLAAQIAEARATQESMFKKIDASLTALAVRVSRIPVQTAVSVTDTAALRPKPLPRGKSPALAANFGEHVEESRLPQPITGPPSRSAHPITPGTYEGV